MARKQSSPSASSIASRVLKDPQFATEDDIKTLAGSVLSQDETAGQAKTEDDVRKMFPNVDLEFTTLSSTRKGLSASWGDGKERFRQSITIPNKPDGLGIAADILRQAVDALSEV